MGSVNGQDDSFNGSSAAMFQSDVDRQSASFWDYLTGRYHAKLYLVASLALGQNLRTRYSEGDLLQETWSQVHRQIDQFQWQSKGSFFRWSCAKIRRVAADLGRPKSFRAEQAVDTSQIEFPSAQQAVGSSSSLRIPEAIIENETLAIIRDSIEDPRLSDVQQQVIIGSFIDGQCTSDLSASLSIPAGTIRKHRERGLKLLKEILAERGIDAEVLFQMTP